MGCGYSGVINVLLIYFLVVIKKYRPSLVIDRKFVLLIVLSQLIYFIPYSIDITAGLLLGLIIGLEEISVHKHIYEQPLSQKTLPSNMNNQY